MSHIFISRCAARSRGAFAGVLVAGVVVVAGCGDGGSSAVSTTPAASSATVLRTTADLPAPAVQAKNVTFPFEVEAWVDRLGKTWGVKPRQRWTATKQGDARWLVRLVLTGDDPSERLVAEWVVRIPLDRAPTQAEVARFDDADSVEPLNADARKLSKTPPVLTGRTARLSGFLFPSSGGPAGSIYLAPELGNDRADDATRRGEQALGTDKAEGLFVTPDAHTQIRTSDGAKVTLSALRKMAATAGGPVITVTWKLDHTPRTAKDLTDNAPVTITLNS